MELVNKVDQVLDRIIGYLLVLGVLGMLLLSLLGILARWLNLSLMWVDPLVRHLVFLCAFLGGVLATGSKRHIGIDILPKFFETKKMHAWGVGVKVMSSLVCFITLSWLTYASIGFVIMEQEYGKPVFFGIHSSVLTAIIPFGAGIMAVRFFVVFLNGLIGPKES